MRNFLSVLLDEAVAMEVDELRALHLGPAQVQQSVLYQGV